MINHTQKAFWHAWLNEIIKGTSENEIRRHIRKHVEELDLVQTKKEKREWIASMKNLIYIFEGIENEDVGIIYMLSRLNEKFLDDPDSYDPPPKTELNYRNKKLIVPSKFEIERSYDLKEILTDLIGKTSEEENNETSSSVRSSRSGGYKGGIS